MEIFGDLLAGADDEAHVRVLGLAQGRGHADVDGIELTDDAEIGGRADLAGFHQRLQYRRGNVLNVGFALHDRIDFALLDIDAGHAKSRLGELDHERQADVSQAYYTHVGLVCFDLPAQLLEMVGHVLVSFPRIIKTRPRPLKQSGPDNSTSSVCARKLRGPARTIAKIGVRRCDSVWEAGPYTSGAGNLPFLDPDPMKAPFESSHLKPPIRILCIAGARPNFMKLAPLFRAFASAPEFDPVLVHTGQHYDDKMSGQFFRDLGLPTPAHNLEVGSSSHAQQTADIMKRFEPVLLQEAPRAVLVVGDVNSTVACALVAQKLGVFVIHVEAGLRSFDRSMPEEINRLVTDA